MFLNKNFNLNHFIVKNDDANMNLNVYLLKNQFLEIKPYKKFIVHGNGQKSIKFKCIPV
jgi:hypothetical protein